MLKFFIRTTGERYLDESIKRELGNNYTLLIDTEHKPVDSFINQLEIISKYDAVLLEDDVILCKNFVEEVEKAISEWSTHIINFFTLPHEYFTTHLGFMTFVYNQCTYYPKGVGELLAKTMRQLRQPYNQYDTLENKALRELVLPHVVYRPCLVQHIDNNTLIQASTNNRRRTLYFKDYLDELGIDYLVAYKYKSELAKMLDKQFNIITVAVGEDNQL